jgi:cytochrome c oxidase cbb3-type subunit 3
MSSRFPASLPRAWLLLLAVATAGCDRETRDSRGSPLPETGPLVSPRSTAMMNGVPVPTASDPRAAGYEGNAFHIAQGSRYFAWMNCSGCHANGGGGMGPPLMDDEWRYGGSMEQIAATIIQGRPNGMPSYRGRVTEQQVWQLAAFIRSLSAQNRQDALPSRTDAPRATEPQTLQERQPVTPTSVANDAATTEGSGRE